MELLEAAETGDVARVKQLVTVVANLDITDHYGRTALTQAAIRGYLDIVRTLLECGADVNAGGYDDWISLAQSTENDNREDNQFFENPRTVVNFCKDCKSPLMEAANRGHLDVVRILVVYGADVNAHDKHGSTPLMEAGKNGHLDVVIYLVKNGAGVEARDCIGWTSLWWPAAQGHLNVVRFLVKIGAAVDARDNDGGTPLTIAASKGHLNVVRFFVEHGANLNASSNDGWTPLNIAIYSRHSEVARFLVECGADVDSCDSEGSTLLMKAAADGNLYSVRFLVEHGANQDLKTTAGLTALSIATKFGRHKVVQFLLLLVRYRDRRAQTQQVNEQMARHANIPSSWLISPFEIEVEPFIDAEHIGVDYHGKWLDADVVVKLFVDDAINVSFVEEVRLWHQLRHPNILKLYGVCNADHYLFVCEYASKGSLPEYLKSCDAERRTPWKFLYEAALGLEYLHERKIVHGNLYGSNILIGSDGLAKLSGFRLSASSSEGIWYASGDWVHWAAPEIMQGYEVSLASDVYSLGMCILEAASGKVPFDGYSEEEVNFLKSCHDNPITNSTFRNVFVTDEKVELLWTMCHEDPRQRPQMPTVIDKLERFAQIENAELAQHTDQSEPEPLMNFDALDEFNHGNTSSLWTVVQNLVDKNENCLYRQIWHELELIYDALKAESHPWSILQRFHDLLNECKHALDIMSQQNQIRRLSATRARDYSVQGLHRQISQLLQLVCPQNQDAETRETEWKRLCREQVELFVSEASEACVMLSSVDSEEDRLALVTVLRAELRNSDGKYTDKQLVVLQKTCDDIVSKSLEDVQHVTAPEWFIPWFELEMNEMATLGEGGFGSVIKAKWLDSEVVVKKLDIDSKDAANDSKKREMRQMFEREVDIWFGLSHPHVVRLFGACHVGRPFFVCELASKGTLVEYLRHHPDELWTKLREAALGVQYLHARDIVHGDLKGNNIMIGSDGKAKVTDFGLSGVFEDDSTEMVVSGAWHWVAPECILDQKPTFASDIYSLGMCVVEALRVTNGEEYTLPWGALPNAAVKFHVTKKHLLPKRPSNCSDKEWTLIERMCKSDPADRMLIMTVVDALEKLADRHGDLGGEADQIASDIGKMRLSSSSVADTLAEMKNWIAKCDTRSNWEGSVLKNIYQLQWDRLELVSTQLLLDSDDTVVTKTTTSEFIALVEHSQMRTRAALGITGDISLIQFTELALGGYALHRRLDKFMAAHAVPKNSNTLHDWTSTCSTFVGVSNSPAPAHSDDDCSANEETG